MLQNLNIQPLMQSKPYSIPFITIDPLNETKFVINQQALKFLKSSSQQISILSICGEYRTGKSFLLNTLFFSNEGFKVSPTTEPCTKGINLWSRPLSISGKNIWILDTQGFGATNRDHNYEVKIFLLTTLLSSILLYNSFGAIDENTVDKFAAICHKARSVDETLDDLKLFWILRDFSLAIQNKDGKVMTSDQYLQQALNQLNKEERKAIKMVFPQRHCVPLVRPVIDQNILQKLDQIEFSQLRGQFVQQIYKLRKKILSQTKQKKIRSMKLTGQNIGLILQQYLNLLNKGQIQTNFSLTWDTIINSEKQRYMLQVQSQLDKHFKQIYKILPLKTVEIQTVKIKVKQIKEQFFKQFKIKFSDSNLINQGSIQLETLLNLQIQKLLQFNSESIKKNQEIFIQDKFANTNLKTLSDFSIEKFQQYHDKIKQIKTDFRKGFSCYDLFWKQKISQMISPRQQTTLNLLIQKWKVQYFQLKSQKEQIQKRKKILQNDCKKYKEDNTKLKKQLESALKQKEKQIKQLKQKIEDLKIQQQNKLNQFYQEKLQAQKQQNQKNMNDLKTTILQLQKQFLVLKKQQKYQKDQLVNNTKFQTQKIELLTNKLDQSKIVHEKSMEQLKDQYQAKLKKYDQRSQQTLNQLNHQRKKFLQLNQSKKQQQSQLLQDIAQKNQKVIILRRQLASIQIKYKDQLQALMEDQKHSLNMQFSIKVQEYEHKIRIFLQKLEQYSTKIKQLQLYQHESQTLTIENRLQKQQLEVLCERFNQLVQKLKKNKQIQAQKDRLLQSTKQKYEMDLSDQKQCMKNLKVQLKQIQEQHQNEMKLLQIKYQSQAKDRIEKIKDESLIDYETKLKQVLNYKEKQANVIQQNIKKLNTQMQALKFQCQNKQKTICQLRIFLSTINKTYQDYCRQIKQIQKQQQSRLLNKSYDSSIREMPEEQHYDKHVSKNDISLQIQYSSQLFKIAFEELKQMFEERHQIKNSLKQTVCELQLCQNVIKQLKLQNLSLQDQIQSVNKKNSKSLTKLEISQIQQNIQTLKKKNNLLQKEVQIRDQIYSKRQQSIRQNIQLYKETINNLTEQNNQLNQRLMQLQCDLNRFTTWEGDFNYQETQKFNQQVITSQIGNKIQMLQKINKKLKKQLQNEKQMALLNCPGVLNNVINQTKITQIQTIKKQNIILRKRLEQLRQRQIRLNHDLTNAKNIIYHQEETKLLSLRDEYDEYRKKTKDQIFQLQKQLQKVAEENKKLKQQLMFLKQKIEESGAIKSSKLDIQNIKQRNHKQQTLYETTINTLKKQLSQIKNSYDKQTAILELSYGDKQIKLQQQRQVLRMQCEKSSAKYGHLLKVNSDLMRQMQNLKNKSAQSIVKQKFKNQIQSLFDD